MIRAKIGRGRCAALAALLLTVACTAGEEEDSGEGGENGGPAPAIARFTSAPGTIVPGDAAVLTAVFTNGTAVIEPGVGAVTSDVPVTVRPSETTVYTLTVTGTAGRTVRANATVNVTVPPVDPPEIAEHPQSTTVVAGATATFSVVAVSERPLTYQWDKDGTPIVGATASTLELTNVQESDAGEYGCVVTATFDDGTRATTVSDTATLRVNVLPRIVGEPQDVTVVEDGAATFTVAADANGVLEYRWTRDAVEIPGATSSALTLTNVQAEDAGSYQVEVVNRLNGTVTATLSRVATLTVNVAPAITTHPEPVFVAAGGTATFSVEASGSGSLGYQWEKGGSPIPGATARTLVLDGVTPGDAGSYRVLVTNTLNGTVTSTHSSGAALTVNVPPTIAAQPQPVVVVAGGSATFGVTATGSGTLGYQWQRDGADLAGETASTLSLADVQPEDAGEYRVRVTNALSGTVTSTLSAGATLTVNAPPAIVAQPQPATVAEGGSVTFDVEATAAGTLGYQWQKDGVDLPGATGRTLTVENVTPAHAGEYRVVVTSVLGTTEASTTSASAALVVNARPVIVQNPAPAKVLAGSDVTFRVTATAAGALSYQWEKDGEAIPGATSSELDLRNVQRVDAGLYRVVVTSTLNGTTAFLASAAAALTVEPTTCTWDLVLSEPLDALPSGATVESGDWEEPRVERIDGRWAWHQASDENWLRIPFEVPAVSSYFEVEVDLFVPERRRSLGTEWDAHDIVFGVFGDGEVGVEARLSIPPTLDVPTFSFHKVVRGEETEAREYEVPGLSGGWHTVTLVGDRDACRLRLFIDSARWGVLEGVCDLGGGTIVLGSTNPRADQGAPGIAWSELTVSGGDAAACMEDERLRIIPVAAVAHADGLPVPLYATFRNEVRSVEWALDSPVGSLSATSGEFVEYSPPETLEEEELVVVTATMGDYTAHATILVTPPVVLEVSPTIATVVAGGDAVTFEATVTNTTSQVYWTLIPALGELSERIGAQVVYTPPADVAEERVVTLIAMAAGESAMAQIRVRPPPSLAVTAESALAWAGEDPVRLTATRTGRRGPL